MYLCFNKNSESLINLKSDLFAFQVIMQQGKFAGRMVEDSRYDIFFPDDVKFYTSQCFPLFSFLLALNLTTIDYFSLDVEGLEYKVLASMPWDRVNIRVRHFSLSTGCWQACLGTGSTSG